jgi:hypothetical protein
MKKFVSDHRVGGRGGPTVHTRGTSWENMSAHGWSERELEAVFWW